MAFEPNRNLWRRVPLVSNLNGGRGAFVGGPRAAFSDPYCPAVRYGALEIWAVHPV